jgi:hypothetical protein
MAFGGFGTLAWVTAHGAAGTASPLDPGRRDPLSKQRLHMPSPWQSGRQLTQLPWVDLFGVQLDLITRDQAMTIPGVARGRGIILSLIADKPLIAFRAGERLPSQHSWLYRVPGWQGPWRRMANTLDDHIFYPWSLWGTLRGAPATTAPTDDATTSKLGPILQAWHIPYDDWQLDDLGRICVIDLDGHYVPADESEVLLIPGPSEGLLAYATRTLAGAVELERAWTQRAKNPIPMIDLHETVQSGMTDTEAQEVVDAWSLARSAENGGIAYTPNTIEARALGQYSPDFFIAGRNSSRLDVAAFLQLPGSLLDASTATASLTYTTQETQTSSLDLLTIPYWCRAIEDRLSQDDVVPIGQIVRFGFADAYTEPPGPIVTMGGAAAIKDPAVRANIRESAPADDDDRSTP